MKQVHFLDVNPFEILLALRQRIDLVKTLVLSDKFDLPQPNHANKFWFRFILIQWVVQ